MIGTANSDPSKDKLEELPFGMGEDGEHVLKSNIMQDWVKPTPGRNPQPRVTNGTIARKSTVWVEGLAIVKYVMDILVGLDLLHF
jgi:hypothetical protein